MRFKYAWPQRIFAICCATEYTAQVQLTPEFLLPLQMKTAAQEGSLNFDQLNPMAENLNFGKIYPEFTFYFNGILKYLP